MKYVACRLAYDGSAFHGSQRQINAFTVQQAVEEAVESVCCHQGNIILAGRTDSGVHATGQCFRFATTSRIPVKRFSQALNANLDTKIRVSCSRQVTEEFHPRFSAISRTYRYWIDNGDSQKVLLSGMAAYYREPLNLQAMQYAARHFVGKHDFVAWQSAGSPAPTTVRNMKRLEVRRLFGGVGTGVIEIEIEANAFLYRMVRNIVGALIYVGHGKLAVKEIPDLTRSKDRKLCPPPAPPQGLCLVDVKYDWGKFLV